MIATRIDPAPTGVSVPDDFGHALERLRARNAQRDRAQLAASRIGTWHANCPAPLCVATRNSTSRHAIPYHWGTTERG